MAVVVEVVVSSPAAAAVVVVLVVDVAVFGAVAGEAAAVGAEVVDEKAWAPEAARE